MIAEPPLEAGAVKVTVACVSPAVAVPIVGAPGGPALGRAPRLGGPGLEGYPPAAGGAALSSLFLHRVLKDQAGHGVPELIRSSTFGGGAVRAGPLFSGPRLRLPPRGRGGPAAAGGGTPLPRRGLRAGAGDPARAQPGNGRPTESEPIFIDAQSLRASHSDFAAGSAEAGALSGAAVGAGKDLRAKYAIVLPWIRMENTTTP